MAAKKGKGKRQRQSTGRGRERTPDYAKIYRYKLPPISLDTLDFRLSLLGGSRTFDLRPIAESIDWQDDDGYSGTVTLRRPDPQDFASLPVERGMEMEFSVLWDESWYKLWRLRCGIPDSTTEEGAITVELTDEFDAINRSKRDWTYRKTKGRRRGYYPHEITRLVCHKLGVSVGVLPKAKHRLDKLVKKNASGLDVIKAAWQNEREKTGQRYVIRMRDGRLEVVPFKRNPILYILQSQIQSATFSGTGKSQPVTVLVGRARLGKGGSAKKITHTETRKNVVKKIGYVRDEKNYGRVRDRAELRSKVRRDYADGLKIKRTATISHPLVPFIRRGDGIRVEIPAEGWTGKTSYAWVTAASFSVSSDVPSMELEVDQEDPFIKALEDQEKDMRKAKRDARKKRKS